MKTPEQQKEGIRVFADVDRNDIYITYEGNEEEPNATLYLDEDLKESPISAADLVEKAKAEWKRLKAIEHQPCSGIYYTVQAMEYVIKFLEAEVGK